MGLEPTTSCLQSRRSSRLSYVPLLETEDNALEQSRPNAFESWDVTSADQRCVPGINAPEAGDKSFNNTVSMWSVLSESARLRR